MYNFKFNNKNDGSYIEYYDNGKIWYKCNYKNNKLEGAYTIYYENSYIMFKCNYKNNKKESYIGYYV